MAGLTSLLPYFFQYGYIALFVFMFLGAWYLPVPSNMALLGAGILSHGTQHGTHFNILLAAGVGLVGCVSGDIAAYFFARHFADGKHKRKFEKDHAKVRKIEKYLKDHPILTVSISRLIGFMTPIVNTLAGFSKMHAVEFIESDVLGNVVYVLLYMGIGYLIGTTSGHTMALLGIGTAAVAIFMSLYIGSVILLREKK